MRRQGSGVGQITKGSSWANAGSEQSVADLFSDPIAQALMWVDGVTVNGRGAAAGRSIVKNPVPSARKVGTAMEVWLCRQNIGHFRNQRAEMLDQR